ncbi:MAG: M48 family metallopeptidase [Clostridia bacterium]|nr:M48 family metallopeptidase [Clostridia bacterium]
MIEPKQIIRSNRKTIALVVNTNGELIVRAPHIASTMEINSFVAEKQGWISKKINSVATFDEKYSSITMSTGDVVPFVGEDYIVELCETQDVAFDGKVIKLPNSEHSKDVLTEYLKKQALFIISERVERYSKLMGVQANSIKITDAKHRWGSCSQNNSLNFAWRLVMCPMSVIDYVVVHELSHIDYKNHSKQFWVRVRTVLPKFELEQNWLKANRKIMEII